MVKFDKRCDRCLATAHEPNFERRDEVFGGGGDTQAVVHSQSDPAL